MSHPLNWDDIYSDYLDSGLSQPEFYTSRLPDYCDSDWTPSWETFRSYMKRSRARAFAKSAAESTRRPKALGDNMQIVELSESAVRRVTGQRTVSAPVSGNQLLRVRFPNGGIAEFETCSPERSVAAILQAIRGSAS